MKSKTLLLLLTLAMTLSFAKAQVPAEPGPSYFLHKTWVKRILIDEGTAESCVACSRGGLLLKAFMRENPGCILIAHHGGPGYKDPFFLEQDNIMDYLANGTTIQTSYPAFMIDRKILYNANNEGSETIWEGYVPQSQAKERLAEKPEAMVRIEGNYDTTKKLATLRVKVDLPADAQDLRLVIYVVEDDIPHIKQQMHQQIPYHHHGLVRDLISAPVGDFIDVAADAKVFEKTFTYDLSDEAIAKINKTPSRMWQRENVKFVVALVSYPKVDINASDWTHQRFLALQKSRVWNSDEVSVANLGKIRHLLTTESDKEGVKLLGKEYYYQGDSVRLYTDKPEGLLCWSINGKKLAADKKTGAATFEMIDEPVVAKAIYDPKNVPTDVLAVAAVTTEDLQLYPNPAYDRVYLKGCKGTIAVYDMAGRRVYKAANAVDNIEVSQWERGGYVVVCTTAHGIATRKVELR